MTPGAGGALLLWAGGAVRAVLRRAAGLPVHEGGATVLAPGASGAADGRFYSAGADGCACAHLLPAGARRRARRPRMACGAGAGACASGTARRSSWRSPTSRACWSASRSPAGAWPPRPALPPPRRRRTGAAGSCWARPARCCWCAAGRARVITAARAQRRHRSAACVQADLGSASQCEARPLLRMPAGGVTALAALPGMHCLVAADGGGSLHAYDYRRAPAHPQGGPSRACRLPDLVARQGPRPAGVHALPGGGDRAHGAAALRRGRRCGLAPGIGPRERRPAAAAPARAGLQHAGGRAPA